MSQVLDVPILGLDSTFPDHLFLLFQSSSGRYGCCCHGGIHGLACFSTSEKAFVFASRHGLSGMSSASATFDEAREIAKGRPLPVIALMLLDDPESPEIHYIR